MNVQETIKLLLLLFCSKQAKMWKDGELYRQKMGLDGPIRHTSGIYSFHNPEITKQSILKKKLRDNVSGILEKVDTMKLNDREDNNYDAKQEKVTQGDKLNQIKAQRSKGRAAAIPV